MKILIQISALIPVAVLAYLFGDYAAQKHSIAEAHDALRAVWHMQETFPVIEVDGKKQYAWPTKIELPPGVMPLYSQNKSGQIKLDKKFPLLYVRPQFSKGVIIVLFSDGARREMNIEDLNEFQTIGS